MQNLAGHSDSWAAQNACMCITVTLLLGQKWNARQTRSAVAPQCMHNHI